LAETGSKTGENVIDRNAVLVRTERSRVHDASGDKEHVELINKHGKMVWQFRGRKRKGLALAPVLLKPFFIAAFHTQSKAASVNGAKPFSLFHFFQFSLFVLWNACKIAAFSVILHFENITESTF
jgi:hypothetical protein